MESDTKRGPGRPPNIPKLKFWKTHPNVILPKFQTEQAACFDLAMYAEGKFEYSGFNRDNKMFSRPIHMDGKIYLSAGDRVMAPTGMIMDIPEGYSVRIHPRSGSALKTGLVLANLEGVIDSDYVNEVMVLLWNTSDNGLWVENGSRIAQAELTKLERYTIEETNEKPEKKTDRNGGMGSTGS
jgi:dUTP pyrophosphatase